jgi:heme-degrading monooxygenase HmoA
MVKSILTRKTSVREREQWQSRLDSVLPKVRAVLEAEPGFQSVEYVWGAENDGEFAQITVWDTLENCSHYVRDGGAATVGALEDRAIPTASHPDGAWTRKTYEEAA